jgi:hypothetical protein
MRIRGLAVLLILAVPSLASTAASDTLNHNDYGVFCVRGRLSVEHRRIEEIKATHGEDVCRLDQDPTESGARSKILRLGGTDARCSCE